MAPGFSSGDAIGSQMCRMRALFREWGYESQVYAPIRDQRLPDAGLPPSDYPAHPDSVLVYHYSAYSPLNDLVLALPGKVVFYYHNVTPPHFFRPYDPDFAARLARGRDEARRFRSCFQAWSDSEYNARDLTQMGFGSVTVIPLFIHIDELLSTAESPQARRIAHRYSDGWVNWLFVGRLAPNKCQHDIIRAFKHYHRSINPLSRLFLVGSDGGLPAYRRELELMAADLVPECVHLPGPVSFEDLTGYYQAASLFVSMSEHEGFGIPLIEAMGFDIPVLAFKAAAVPETLGGAGVLVNGKHHGVIAEMAELLTRDPKLRGRIIEKQRERLRQLTPERARNALLEAVQSLQADG